MGFGCQSTACSQGLEKSGPYPDPTACETDCENNKWYCCINIAGDLNCFQLPFGYGYYAVSGPYETIEECTPGCDDETTGACCPGFEMCDNPNSDCESAESMFAKNECGVCEERFPDYGDVWSQDMCRVYEGTNCAFSGEGPNPPIGWKTLELCRNDGKVWNGPCQDGVYAYQCPPWVMGQTFHPNKQCYEVNCPGDCYASGDPSPCGGHIGEDYPGPTCLAGFLQCDAGTKATVTISGAEPPVVDVGGTDACAADLPNAYQKAADMVNSTFILEQSPPEDACFAPVTVVDYATDTVGGTSITMKVVVTVQLLLQDPTLDYPDSNTTPGTPACGKNICYRVQVDVNIFSCPNNDPPTCAGAVAGGGSTALSDRVCSTLEVLFSKACDCQPNPIPFSHTLKCQDYFSSTLHTTGSTNSCTECADGATVSVTIE